MTPRMDRRNAIRSYYSDGTIVGAMHELSRDIVDGVIHEVYMDYVFARYDDLDGWTVGVVYSDEPETTDED